MSETVNEAEQWIATWAGGTVPPWLRWLGPDRGFCDQTLRQMLFTTAGGDAVRARFSNRWGRAPLRIGGASVGVTRRARAAELIAESARPLTFDGADSVVIPPGGEVTSDAVSLVVLPHQVIAIDTYFPEHNDPPEYTLNFIQAAYLAQGRHVGDESGACFAQRVNGAYFEGLEREGLSALTAYAVGLEVANSPAVGCIVVTGDSLTFGRWPQWLSRRLRRAYGDASPSVVHIANSGQKLCSDTISAPSLVSRFQSDILSVNGISHVIVSIGFNDLAIPSPSELVPILEGTVPPAAPDGATAGEMIRCYAELIELARAAGVLIYACTIPPGNGGAWNVGLYGRGYGGEDLLLELWPERNEGIRQEVNAWLRHEAEVEAVFDFADVLENRLDRTVQDPLYSDDGAHLNVGGWFEMAQAVDIEALGRRSL